MVFRRFPSWKSYCELIGRTLKEEYFLNEERWANTPCSSIAPIYADAETVLTPADFPLRQGYGPSSGPRHCSTGGPFFPPGSGGHLDSGQGYDLRTSAGTAAGHGGASRMKFFQEALPGNLPPGCPGPMWRAGAVYCPWPRHCRTDGRYAGAIPWRSGRLFQKRCD